MGKLVLHHWARLLALSASAYMAWGEIGRMVLIDRGYTDREPASFWAFLFRKFFWDMIGGTLGPAGIIPGSNTQPFVDVIVNIPLLQSFTLILAIGALALEWPLPFIKGTAVHRSFLFRAIYYFIAGFIGILIYQTVDCAVYMVITSGVYTMAISRGEVMEGDKARSSGEA